MKETSKLSTVQCIDEIEFWDLDLIRELVEIGREVHRARAKFPGNRFLLGALTEEVGEVARDLLQKKPTEKVQKECRQVACVAIRLSLEGDQSFRDITDEEAKP